MSENSGLKEIQSMKVVDIKKELQKRGLALSGNKPDLVERLSKSLLEEADLPSPDGDAEADLQDEKEILGDSTFFNASKDDGEDEGEDESTASENEAVTIPVKEDRLRITQPEETDAKVPAKDSATSVTVSQGERLIARSQRFGTCTETDKKQKRAERFGLGDTGASKDGGGSALKDHNSGSFDKLKQRADRFGTTSLTVNKLDEDEKIKKRKERFGEVVDSGPAAKKLAINNNTISLSKSPSTDLLKKRAERFGL